MSKRLLTLFVSIMIIFSTSYIPFANYSPEETIAESKKKFKELDNSIMETNLEISNLNSEIAALNNTIKNNDIDIEKSINNIEELEAQMERLKVQISDSQEVADRRLRAMYKNAYSKSYLSLVLTSKNFSDFFIKLDAAEKIASMDKKLLADLELKKRDLNNSIDNLNLKHKQLQQLKNSNIASLENVKSKKTSLDNLKSQFNAEKKAATQIIKENEEKLIAHAISVIDSQTTNINTLKSALSTLKSLLPQLTTPSVKDKVEEYIAAGDSKLEILLSNGTDPNDNPGNDTYKATYTMVATAYSGHSITSMGLKPVRDPNGLSTIAVDRSIIPLGTKVYIPGYGYAICADTGGAIKGYKIDLFLNSETECYNWGRRNVTLHIIAYPGEW